MADEPSPNEAPEPKKKRSRLPLWIGVIVVIELVAAVAIVKIAVPSEDEDASADWEKEATVITRDVDDVIVNLMDEGAKRILRVHIAFEVLAEDPAKASAAIQRPMVVEDKLNEVLSRKRLVDIQGRQAALKDEIIDILQREILTDKWQEENGRARITQLLMPTFVIQ